MDKVTLTKEQLRELKRYIHSRGFREPLIVMEILDHFACLVEEKMQAKPNLTLDEAMKEAHSSFGIMGFKALADAAAVERNKRYNKQFKTNIANVFSNPLIWLVTILSAVPFYQFTLWMQVQDWGWLLDGGDVMFVIVLMVYIGSSVLVMPRQNNRCVSGYGKWADNGYAWAMYLMIIGFPHYRAGGAGWFFATADTAICAFIIIYNIGHYRAAKNIAEEVVSVEKQHAEL